MKRLFEWLLVRSPIVTRGHMERQCESLKVFYLHQIETQKKRTQLAIDHYFRLAGDINRVAEETKSKDD